MDLTTIAPILEEIIKENLTKKQFRFGFAKHKGMGNKVASGKLRNSITVIPEKNKLVILMEEYGRYVQQGQRGGRFQSRKGGERAKKGEGKKPLSPFIMSLIDWIKKRHIHPQKGSIEGMAFGIRTNILKFGVRPSDFVYLSIEDILKDPRIPDLIGDATFADLIKIIEGKI